MTPYEVHHTQMLLQEAREKLAYLQQRDREGRRRRILLLTAGFSCLAANVAIVMHFWPGIVAVELNNFQIMLTAINAAAALLLSYRLAVLLQHWLILYMLQRALMRWIAETSGALADHQRDALAAQHQQE